MSEVALDRSVFPPGTFTDWYRERPFQIAFAASVVIHALLIAFVPGLRSVRIEALPVLNVEIVIPEEQRPVTREAPARAEPQPDVIRQPEFTPPPAEVRPVEPPPVAPEPIAEPLARPPEPEITAPVQRAELAPPVAREAPRPEPITLPRPDPLPEQRLELPVEPKPVPQVQPIAPPPPVARIEPRPEPSQLPRVEPRPEFVPEPAIREMPPAPPVQRPVAPATVQPRVIEPMPPPPAQPLPAAPAVAIRAQPPVAAPAPPAAPAPSAAAPTDALARELTRSYSQQISTQIKRYQKYPVIAQRRGWEGTAEVLLKIAPDGRVTEVVLGKSTGRDILDREAMEMVRRSFPLPQAPQQLRGRELSVTVPIIFRLQES
jgi:protein TonB